ncbi:MAG: hypothetical protein AAGM45_13110 [Cyanobacteria bacterium J06588_5]
MSYTTPEELHFQFPHIALGKIYSALAYDWDHQAALDADMKARLEKVNLLQQQAPPSRIAVRLSVRGAIT